MPLISNLVEYETDDEKTVFIKIKYEDNNTQRLTKGGMTVQTGACGFTMPRKWLKPRFIDYRITKNNRELIERVYYKKHSEWKDDIEANKNTIVKACGECLSCTAIGALYTN